MNNLDLQKSRNWKIAVASIIAALYAVLVILLPAISFMAWQVRIADALLPLSTVLGWPAVLGVTIGCFIGNLAAPWGSWGLVLIDAIGGSIANFLSSYIAYKIAYKKTRIWRIIAAFIEVLVVTAIVGTYLTFILTGSIELGIPLFTIMSGIFVGSIISIGVIGLTLTEAVVEALLQRKS